MDRKLLAKLVGGVCLAMTSSCLMADEYHYNNILIGDRASGMGGAYTAISDDSSGLFYNPAGIVYSEELKLSASVNAFNSSSITYKGVLGSGDWTRESSGLFPNFFGMTQQLGDGYFGFSYTITDAEVENQVSKFTNVPGVPLFLVNINNRDTTTKIGPSYAIAINDQLNFGATLYLHMRERELINNQWIRLANDTYEWSNSYYETEETGLNPILGLMWSPTEDLSIGLSIRKTFILSSKTKTQSGCSSDINDPSLQAAICIPSAGSPQDPAFSSNDDERELPLNIRVGVAYFPTNRLLFDADLSYYEATDSGNSSFIDTEETINLAFGLEYYYSDNWAFRGGIYTNNANTPSVKSGKANQADHVDLTGVSLSLTRFTKSSSVTFGFAFSSGEGEAQVLAGNDAIQDVEQSASSIYLSTSYQF